MSSSRNQMKVGRDVLEASNIYFGPICVPKTIQQLRTNMLVIFGECFSQSADSPISRWFFDPCFLGRPFCGMNLTPPSPFDSTRYLCNSFRIHISLSESGAKTEKKLYIKCIHADVIDSGSILAEWFLKKTMGVKCKKTHYINVTFLTPG